MHHRNSCVHFQGGGPSISDPHYAGNIYVVPNKSKPGGVMLPLTPECIREGIGNAGANVNYSMVVLDENGKPIADSGIKFKGIKLLELKPKAVTQ